MISKNNFGRLKKIPWLANIFPDCAWKSCFPWFSWLEKIVKFPPDFPDCWGSCHTSLVEPRSSVWEKAMSSPVALSFGVPQGSVLGPILFTLYSCTLGSICTKHDINYHMYADDQQIYLSFKPSKAGDKENCIRILEMCISEIREWMIVNKLKLNDDKMEFIVFGYIQQLSKNRWGLH